MSDKGAAYQAEAVNEKPRKRGCAGHCVKFWWAYLIGVVVVVVIVVPVILLVAVPKIAQNKLDHAELIVNSITLSNPAPDSFTMAIDNTILSDGGVHAKIEPFEGVMYLEDTDEQTPFVTLQFPETTSQARQEVQVEQRVEIKNMTAFVEFNKWLVQKDKFRVTVLGETGIRVRGIARRYPVTFKKTIDMIGLKHFEGTEVFDATVKLGEAKQNFLAKTKIPNRSIVTFDVGNATFNNFLMNENAGTVYINNMVVKPGDNVYDITADIDQQKILAALVKKPYCDRKDKQFGIIPVELGGKTFTFDGKRLPYFEQAMAAGRVTVNIDIGKPLKEQYPIVYDGLHCAE